MDISIVIPAYNEEENVKELYEKVSKVLKNLKKKYEIIFIDDGSTDSTFQELAKIHREDKAVKVIKFKTNSGQTAAWNSGFSLASGKYIITMDADNQNDPNDIPRLLAKIGQGYDVVSGWRYDRKDSFSKKIFSLFSRFLRRAIINDGIHDSGCSLKIYKRECLNDLELHGEMHRYIAELLFLQGYKIGEARVNHMARKKGKTKYGLKRIPKGFLDLLVIAFWQRYSRRPIHLFGGLGILMGLLGGIVGAHLVYVKFTFGESIANRPLLLLSALLIIVGIQLILFGLIADILMKIYYKGKKKDNVEKVLK